MKPNHRKKATTGASETAQALTFRRAGYTATVVTNGERHAVYQDSGRKFFPTMSRAVAFLEARGYSIDMEAWT